MPMFFFYPILELITLIYFGRNYGFINLVSYLIFSFFIGLNLIKSAGFKIGQPITSAESQEVPFRLMAGFLILIPGVLSDVLALLILIPFVRRFIWTYFVKKAFNGRVFVQSWAAGQRPQSEETVERDVTPKKLLE